MRSRIAFQPIVISVLLLPALGGLVNAVTPNAAGADTAAANDGPPVISSTVPQAVPTAGNVPIRIAGSGFLGTTSVTFGGIPAPNFKVIDGTLLTATVPAQPASANNRFLDIAITDNQGTGSSIGASGTPDLTRLFSSNAMFTVTPDTGLHVGDTVMVNVTGYTPNVSTIIPEFNPLLLFLEGNYPTAPGGPPQYAKVSTFATHTDANGNLLNGPDPGAVPLLLSDLIGSGRQQYDPNIQCPPNQSTADYGLNQCAVAMTQFGVGTVEHFISFTSDPVPAAPTLGLSRSTAAPGNTVNLSGIHWNASPYFGSSTSQSGPGESQLTVELCNAGLTTCTRPAGNASVPLTRYFDGNPNYPFPYDPNHICPDNVNYPGQVCVQPQFTGATLSGSLTVDNTSGCAPNCVVRVRQEHWDYNTRAATGTFITAIAPLTVRPPLPPADFTGDAKTDLSVFRPSTGTWFVQGATPEATPYGTNGDVPVPGDYDGDAKTDIAVFRQGVWYVHQSTGGDVAVGYGTTGDIPVPADYTGDGKTDIAVFRPADGGWYIHQSSGGDTVLGYGTNGDVAVPGDYDGDGHTDIAVFRPSQGAWYIHKSTGGDVALGYGTSGDIPVPGDYDGDGHADIAVFRPSQGAWYIHQSSGGDTVLGYGTNGDMPVPGDYDGDAKTDVAVFRPSQGAWYIHRSSGGDTALAYGTTGDLPVPLPSAIRMAFFPPGPG